MKPSKTLGILGILIAILALTSTTTTLAQAATLPSILPTAGPGATELLTAKSSSKLSTFGNGLLSVESAESTGTLTGNSVKLGSFKVELLKSKSVLGPICTGLTDTTTGIILISGTFHIRDTKDEGTLKTAAVFLLAPVHFECAGAALVIWLGCLAGTLTPENVLTKTLMVTLAHATGNEKDNLIITILNEENNTEELCQMLASQNGGSFKLAVLVMSQTLTGFKQNGAEVTVLVMRL